MVFLTESMLGMPSPPAVRPLDPSAAMVKWVRGASRVSEPWALALAAPPVVAAARASRAAHAVTAVLVLVATLRTPWVLWTGWGMRTLLEGDRRGAGSRPDRRRLCSP